MINFTSRTKYFISSKPTDMRNGREGLAGIVREVMVITDKDSHINVMGKTYTLEDGENLMAELKSTRGMMAEMKGRLERDEITPDECMFRCIAMGRRHSSHAARAMLACYQRDARIISRFPRTMVEGKKRQPDSVNLANYKPK